MTVTTEPIASDVVGQSDCLIIANPIAAGVDADSVREITGRLQVQTPAPPPGASSP